jgi:hypothetical protein
MKSEIISRLFADWPDLDAGGGESPLPLGGHWVIFGRLRLFIRFFRFRFFLVNAGADFIGAG